MKVVYMTCVLYLMSPEVMIAFCEEWTEILFKLELENQISSICE